MLQWMQFRKVLLSLKKCTAMAFTKNCFKICLRLKSNLARIILKHVSSRLWLKPSQFEIVTAFKCRSRSAHCKFPGLKLTSLGPTYIFSQLTEGRCRRPLLTEGQLQKATSILSKKRQILDNLHQSIHFIMFTKNLSKLFIFKQIDVSLISFCFFPHQLLY